MNDEQESDKTLADAVRAFGLKQQLFSIHKKVMPELRPHAPLRNLGRAFLRVAAVLILAVFISLLYLYISSSGETLFAGKYKPYTIAEVRGDGSGSSQKTSFLAALAALQKDSVAQAAAGFRQLLTQNQASAMTAFSDDAEYYLALSYLKMGEVDRSRQLFQHIHDTPNHLYNDQVSNWFLFRLTLVSYK